MRTHAWPTNRTTWLTTTFSVNSRGLMSNKFSLYCKIKGTHILHIITLCFELKCKQQVFLHQNTIMIGIVRIVSMILLITHLPVLFYCKAPWWHNLRLWLPLFYRPVFSAIGARMSTRGTSTGSSTSASRTFNSLSQKWGASNWSSYRSPWG